MRVPLHPPPTPMSMLLVGKASEGGGLKSGVTSLLVRFHSSWPVTCRTAEQRGGADQTPGLCLLKCLGTRGRGLSMMNTSQLGRVLWLRIRLDDGCVCGPKVVGKRGAWCLPGPRLEGSGPPGPPTAGAAGGMTAGGRSWTPPVWCMRHRQGWWWHEKDRDHAGYGGGSTGSEPRRSQALSTLPSPLLLCDHGWVSLPLSPCPPTAPGTSAAPCRSSGRSSAPRTCGSRCRAFRLYQHETNVKPSVSVSTTHRGPCIQRHIALLACSHEKPSMARAGRLLHTWCDEWRPLYELCRAE